MRALHVRAAGQSLWLDGHLMITVCHEPQHKLGIASSQRMREQSDRLHVTPSALCQEDNTHAQLYTYVLDTDLPIARTVMAGGLHHATDNYIVP